MVTFTDIRRHENMPFEDYLKLPGYSHSWLKRERDGVVDVMEESQAMTLGKMVDNILGLHTHGKAGAGEKVEMVHSLYPAAFTIAKNIDLRFGRFLKLMHSQVSYTATVEYNGFYLPIRGRLDYELRGLATLDLKITQSKNPLDVIEYMKYDNQLFMYGGMAGTRDRYILIYSVPLRECFLFKRHTEHAHEWMGHKVLLHGQPIA